MEQFSHAGHTISISKEEPKISQTLLREIIRGVCLDAGILRKKEIILAHREEYYDTGVIKEEQMILAQKIAKASLHFERNRLKVIHALRAIVSGIITKYNLPTNGLDIGSGATGAMVNEFLPEGNWLEMDINYHAVEENKLRHPKNAIVLGSYLRLSDIVGNESLNMVTGLSSLDSTSFLSLAISSIWSVLKPGGYLLHVQDVRPGNGVTSRWVRRQGYLPPHNVDLDPDDNIYGLYDGHEHYLSASELFRRDLQDIISNRNNAEIILNHWVSAKAPTKSDNGTIYYQNVALSGFPTTPLPETMAAAVVTIARKVK